MSDIKDTQDLAALLGSRLCHDLISPIGAIGNGLELLELSGAAPSEELQLIRASVDAATARIRFFRVAFGAAGAGQLMAARDIRATLEAMYGDSRLKVRWSNDEDQERLEAKVAFLALACLEQAMPWGGTVEVRASTNAWVLHAQAERFKHEPRLWDMLSRGTQAETLAGSEVQFGLLRDLSQSARRPISVTITDQSLSILV